VSLESSSRGRLVERCCAEGCKGKGTCSLRKELYDSPIQDRTIAQSYMIEAYCYLEGYLVDKDIHPIIWQFWLSGGGSDRFREAWARGVRDLIQLENEAVVPSLMSQTPSID